MMRTELLRFDGAVERDPAVDAWMKEHAGELGAIAHQWFEVMRKCGDEVRELLHDGCPVACLGDAPFGYVNVFTSHLNVGFFHGTALPDPDRLLQGTGKFMRHVKLRPGTATNAAALSRLVDAAYSVIKARVENGWAALSPSVVVYTARLLGLGFRLDLKGGNAMFGQMNVIEVLDLRNAPAEVA